MKTMLIFKKYKRNIKDVIKNFFKMFGFTITKINKKIVSSKIVKNKIGNFYLSMREDHQLPAFLEYPSQYSLNLPRLAVEVLKKYPNMTMIDVGANIGDTVALVRSECYFPIICIDGDNEFFELLQKNIEQFKDVKIFKQLLGDKNETIQAELKKNIETARLQSNQFGAMSIPIMTLDTFLEKHNDITQAKLLKIDTDGYDMKIVRGALEHIKTTKPVLFLEYDPIFLAEQEDNAIPTFQILEKVGYGDIIFYDNLGHFMVSGNLSSHLFLKQMNNYIDPKLRTPFPYYDIAIFHKEDEDIAKEFIKSEMDFFYSDAYYSK